MILAGTGHRENKLTHGSFDQLTAFAEKYLRGCAPDLVISGMATGWDMALAQAAVRLSIPFVAAIPFPTQTLFYSAVNCARYDALLKQAADTVVVTPNPSDFNDAYQKRNRWMVDRCHVLAAWWNGSKGGTCNCVKYAVSQGTPIEYLWLSWIDYCQKLDND